MINCILTLILSFNVSCTYKIGITILIINDYLLQNITDIPYNNLVTETGGAFEMEFFTIDCCQQIAQGMVRLWQYSNFYILL